jgi:hypothetical protein
MVGRDRPVDCSDGAATRCGDAGPTRAAFVCMGRLRGSGSRGCDDSRIFFSQNKFQEFLNVELIPYLLLLLRWALVSRRMVEGWRKVRWLEGVGRLMHGGAMSVVTRRETARSARAAVCVRCVCRAAAAQSDAAAMAREPLLWKRKLLSRVGVICE